MRTVLTAIGLTLLLHLGGCSGMATVARYNPCAVENSIECQVERSARVP